MTWISSARANKALTAALSRYSKALRSTVHKPSHEWQSSAATGVVCQPWWRPRTCVRDRHLHPIGQHGCSQFDTTIRVLAVAVFDRIGDGFSGASTPMADHSSRDRQAASLLSTRRGVTWEPIDPRWTA